MPTASSCARTSCACHTTSTSCCSAGNLVRAQEAGLLAPAEVEAWWDALRAQYEAGTFLAGLCAFIVSGTKARR
jgi:hypothetical protein